MKKQILTIQDLARFRECVFFDAAQPGTINDASYFFSEPDQVVEAQSLKDVMPALRRIDELSNEFWLAGYLRYEAAAAFLPKLAGLVKPPVKKLPLLRFGVYKQPLVVEAFDTTEAYAPARSLAPLMTYADYEKIFKRIKGEIHQGNTYQVNFTFDFIFRAQASPEYLYAFLRDYQRTPYCAFIKNDHEQILSFSPELFFHRRDSRIWTCPMKGTAGRGADDEEDVLKKEALRLDEKNRAENLMIVDLLRNDLGRIAKTGTVSVPSMFDVETHPTLHQMTSLIEADLKDAGGYADIFSALFPCGSVTGAPKIKTMELISRLERQTRGVYCGAIGYISPEQKAVFSVPIRILQRRTSNDAWNYRAGSGIVWDSRPRSEWEEVRMKASFLTAGHVNEIQLVETMLWQDGHISYEQEHLTRLRRSAATLKFSFSESDLTAVLADILEKTRGTTQKILRLLLTRAGGFSYDVFNGDRSNEKKYYKARLSSTCLDRENEWLRHKTTYRPWYQETMEYIKQGVIWDEIFLNQHGEVCEGARSNIFLKKNGALYTPPVICGLLPGIFREDLLKKGQCVERILTLNDLLSADAVYCGNSVRGLVRVDINS